MGQTSNKHYRVGESSDGDFLSPAIGTFTSPIKFLPYMIGIFGLAFLASCITASIMTPVQNSDAANSGINADINSVAYYVNIASNNGSGGVIEKDIQATYMGTLGVIEDVLKVTSNTPSGYQIYVSAASGHDQKLTNTTDPTKFLSPVDSAYSLPSNPGTLATTNTWGVAVDSTYNSAFTGQTYTGDITQAHKFAPLPAYGDEKLLALRTGATTGNTDTINVYYGYHANSALPSGTYANTVLYTAYAESSDTGEHVATYTGDLNYKDGGEVVFTTSLFTDIDLTNTSATVSITDGTTTTACNNVTLGKVQAGTNDSVTVTCNAPAQARPGDYTATISIPSYGYTASTVLAYDTDGITVAGNTIKTMQEMTASACSAWDGGLSSDANWNSTTNSPKPFKGGDSPVYMYGADGTIPESVITDVTSTEFWNTTFLSGAHISNINEVVPETYLKDSRDNNWYRIRKLADGNCWMAENLRLTWKAGDVVATQNGTWTPHYSTETEAEHTNWMQDDGENGEITTAIQSNNIAVSDQDTYRAFYYDHSYDNSEQKVGDQSAGVYYNWKAATAGAGSWSSTTEASDSVCPINWKLPVDTLNGTPAYGSKSYYNLVYLIYGAAGFANSGDRRVSRINAQDTNIRNYHTYTITLSLPKNPLSFRGTGAYANGIPSTGSTRLWASASPEYNTARNFFYYTGVIYTGGSDSKGLGIPVRCVAQ
ncbi:MAG: hypothetical protein Q4E46_03645 [Candidatus Saccharibacteria bacterium]|nr:hypothetical protein [Candidatus Saccharibacteria bacterium]